jgi:hypothetical protein
LLKDLSDWIVGAEGDLQTPFPLPNILLTPLVVITHLSQYWKFLELVQLGSSDHNDPHTSLTRDAETLGLCTGLLSAAAVSCSANKPQLQHYGAVAVRLAMLVGALVDARDTQTSPSKCLSAAWSSPAAAARMTAILETFPEVRACFHVWFKLN